MRLSTTCDENSGGSPSVSTRIFSSGSSEPMSTFTRVSITRSSQVVESLIHIAMEIGAEGYEGHAVGTIIVVGDATSVMERSRQLTLNPFQGISEAERNAQDPQIGDAIKTFAALDGAFVIREDGVVLSAGRYLLTMSRDVKLPMGLGARHSAAASISAETKSIAITVSQTTGTVRVFKAGEIVLELRQKLRRV